MTLVRYAIFGAQMVDSKFGDELVIHRQKTIRIQTQCVVQC